MKFWKEILLLLVGGVITFCVNKALSTLNNEIPYVDMHVDVEKSLISNENLFSDDVKILVGKDEVTEISKVTLYLLNYSDKFFKDMELSIQLRKPNDDIKILNVTALGENQQASMIEKSEQVTDEMYNYTVKSAKRTDEYDEFFQLAIYYEGKHHIKPEDFTVTIVNAEARVRDFDRSHSPENTWNQVLKAAVLFAVICGTIIFVVIFTIIFSWLTRGMDKKFAQKYVQNMLEASKNVADLNTLSPELRNKIIPDLIYEQRMLRWSKLNRFFKLLEGNSEPKRSDFEFQDDGGKPS